MELNYPSNAKTKPEIEKKKVQPVVTGAKKRKKTAGKRFTDIFVSEDVDKVKGYVLYDILIPTAKRTIEAIVTNSLGMILYGERGVQRNNDRDGYRSYNGYYSRDRDRRDESSYRRRGFDYDEVIVSTRSKAQYVLDCLEDMINQYGNACIADLYQLANLPSNNYMDNDYGWTDIHLARIITDRDGYLIKLPRPIPLNR